MPPRAKKARPSDDKGKRHPLNMRTTKEVREKLEAAAAKSGRSLAQETEFRIERSFSTDDMFALFGARQDMFWLAQMLGSVADAVEKRTGQKWTDDPDTYRQLVNAIISILEEFPLVSVDLPETPESMGREMGRLAVERLRQKWREKWSKE